MRRAEGVLVAVEGDRSPSLDPKWLTLTPRERDVLEAVCLGRSDEEIAADEYRSVNTIRRHLKSIRGKIGVTRTTQLIAMALHMGVVPRRPEAFRPKDDQIG